LCKMLENIARKRIAKKPIPFSSTKDWKALRWAAYLGNFEVVWWLLMCVSSKEKGESVKDALKVAKEELQVVKVALESSVESAERDELQRKLKQYLVTVDLLREPPLVTGRSGNHEQSYKQRVWTGEVDKLTEEFDATIVDFYSSKEEDARIDLLYRTCKVKDVIYDNDTPQNVNGPSRIMQAARDAIKKRNETEQFKSMCSQNSQPAYSNEDLKIRWIHIPVNNVSF